MKIISFYLPQFHTFPENDEWWGKGFTEWTNTKKAIPLFKNHYQPHTPYNHDYYDLTKIEVMERQVKEAREYGVYGFCFYHYWFKDGKMLMEKPVEKFLYNKSFNLHFCISWANEPWTRRWDGGSKEVLMSQEYGDKAEWEKHFYYLLPYFKDSRYITENGKPMLIIYRPEIIACIAEMLQLWRELAIQNGLKGLFVLAQGTKFCRDMSNKNRKNEYLDGYIMYEPGYTYAALAIKDKKSLLKNSCHYSRFFGHYFKNKIISILKRDYFKRLNKKPTDICDYTILWNAIMKHTIPDGANYYPGAFTNWDNSARRGKEARIVVGSKPELFQKYMTKQIVRARTEYKKDLIFVTAWNEWAEGAHLEADEKYGYGYLEALKSALENTGEWPE